MMCMDKNDPKMTILPELIKKEIFNQYVFQDIISSNVRFFTFKCRNDADFLYMIVQGMKPRRFCESYQDDHIIYEENQEVSEFYFITEGFIGIGF